MEICMIYLYEKYVKEYKFKIIFKYIILYRRSTLLNFADMQVIHITTTKYKNFKMIDTRHF
jgi:hypothetical protein